MFRALKQLCHRPAVRFGLARDTRSRLRDPRFVSFVSQSNRKSLDTDLQDAMLAGRKLVKRIFFLGLGVGGAWIVLESAQALSFF